MTLTLKGVDKSFDKKKVFVDFNYTFSSGISYIVTGANGVGKSTLLMMLAGIVSQNKGEICYENDGKIIPNQQLPSMVHLVSPHLSFPSNLSVKNLLAFHFSAKPAKVNLDIDKLVHQLALDKIWKKHIFTLSHGWIQKIKLFLAFSSNLKLLLLDEPDIYLDDSNLSFYSNRIGLKDDHQSIIVSTHKKDNNLYKDFIHLNLDKL